MLSILITNDDGIKSDGLLRLAKIARRFGEVWAVAPDGQRSAASHAISLHNTIDIYPYDFPAEGVHAFSCSGTPGDCVRTGCLSIMPHKPDIVISGINHGYNTASDIQYSGTCGAAFEGAFQEILSFAVSEQANDCHEVTERFLPDILAELMKKPLGYGQIYNLNFPGCPLNECRGVLYDRKVSHSMFYRDSYVVTKKLPRGGMRLMVSGLYGEDAEEGTDSRAVVDKYVSVGIAHNIS